jgi:predicted Zn-dependent protease
LPPQVSPVAPGGRPLTGIEDSSAEAQPEAGVLRGIAPIQAGIGIAQSAGMVFNFVRRARLHAVVALAAVITLSVSANAQTRIDPDKNRFSAAQDVELGRRAAAEIRQELPIVRDRRVRSYVERIGERLVAAIPGRLRQPGFRYTFEVVDRREINAFALPGGPIFVNRGMLDAARNDGEVAGVIAHELAHVVLRHGTAQATKGQKFQLGVLAGQILGSIVGGRTGDVISQGSQIGIGTYLLKYTREYEREADLLGAQIMARAGYDPRHMANMFQSIARRSGNGGPEWLSDHPSPANRSAAINREAALLGFRSSSTRQSR